MNRRNARRGAIAAAGILALVVVVATLAVLAGVPLPGLTGTEVVAGPAPRFVDETSSSGLDFTYDGPFEFAVGGGVAAFDCDADGRPELYLAGGAGPAALFRNESTPGALRFTRLAATATDLDGVNGAYPVDVDGDGEVDLVTLRNGENVALRGLGGCRFERANEAWRLDGGDAHTQAFSATWEGTNRWPTVAFGNYVDPAIEDPGTWCEPNELVRPAAAAGTGFGTAVQLTPSFCALSMLFSDWDGSGRRDLRVSNDLHYYLPTEGEEQLWRIAPGDAPRLYTGDDGWVRVQIQGMGIASHDLTGDGLPEVYLTSQAANRLQTLAAGPAQPRYRDIGAARNANSAHPYAGDVNLPSTAWHPEFADVNDDGLIDLFVSKGNVTTQPEYAQDDPSSLLLGQPDGTFVEAAGEAGLTRFERARGAALVDLDLDGRLDLVEAFYGAPVRVWRNAGPAAGSGPAHWLALRLRDAAPNVDAIGAVLEVRFGGLVQRRELTVGGGHAGGQLGWLHVGLGRADGAEVRVTWPGGEAGPWQRVSADTFAFVDRRTQAPEEWVPSRSP